MARPRNSVPAYRKHKHTGRAVVSIYRTDGSRTEIVLPGRYGSEQSKQEYERLLCQLRANGGKLAASTAAKDITIAELTEKFMAHASTYYADPVTKEPSAEVVSFKDALRPLCRLYANTPAAEFGPLALQSLRAAMISGSWMNEEERSRRIKENRPIGLARTTCNRQIGRIRMVFKWGSSVELVPAALFHALATVVGLRRGRSAARETKPVKPVSPAIIDDTLPYLPPTVKDMVQVLLLTGMRCGELCIMRACDLDMSGDVWLYAPERHKGLWRDKERVIAIGPGAKTIIEKYLSTKLGAYLFSPAAQEELIQAERRANRKAPLWPTHMARNAKKNKPNGKRRRERFEVRAVNRAIRRACQRAGIERWHVHQLRHSASRTFSREMGLESARAALGHSSVDMSAMYAGIDVEKAKEVAKRVG